MRIIVFIRCLFLSLMLFSYSNLIVADEIINNSQDSQKQELEDNSEDAVGDVLLQAMSLMGISYKWGGNTPETGMDCSGFIKYVFKKSMGISLPRTAAEMSRIGKKVSLKNIQSGDLIFFNTLGGRRNSHVGMYIGNGKFIHSPKTGDRIKITPYNAYWRAHTNGIKRIIQQDIDEYGHTQVENFVNIHNEPLPSGSIKKHKRKKQNLRQHNKRRNSNIKTSKKRKKNHRNNKYRQR